MRHLWKENGDTERRRRPHGNEKVAEELKDFKPAPFPEEVVLRLSPRQEIIESRDGKPGLIYVETPMAALETAIERLGAHDK